MQRKQPTPDRYGLPHAADRPYRCALPGHQHPVAAGDPECGFQFQGSGMVGNIAMGGMMPVEWYRLDRKTWMSLKSWGDMR